MTYIKRGDGYVVCEKCGVLLQGEHEENHDNWHEKVNASEGNGLRGALVTSKGVCIGYCIGTEEQSDGSMSVAVLLISDTEIEQAAKKAIENLP